MKHHQWCLALAAMILSSPALAAVAPPLGNAQSFAVLGATPDVNNTGATIVTGDLGVSPAASVIGFPPGTVVGGTIHAADATAAAAQASNTTAYNALTAQACNTTFGVPTDLVGMTLVPGVYCFASSASNTGLVQLDAQGNSNAVWVFKTASTLITGPGATFTVINAGQACNVFWAVGSSATLGTTTTFVGNILALTSITLQTGASVSGRLLAQTGTVSLASNAVTRCTALVGATTTIGTSASAGVAPGGLISDTAALAGGAAPTGNITFTLFGPNNAACTGAPIFTSTVPVAGNGSYTSGTFAAALAGTYRWIASYSGDVNNAPSTGLCNDAGESVTVAAVPGPGGAAGIPTLGGTAMMLLALLIVVMGTTLMRRR